MNILIMINNYIKYLYIVLIIIIFVLLIKLSKELKPLTKNINNITLVSEDINNEIQLVNEKVEKIKYTINNSVPLLVLILFIFLVITSAIKDYHETKNSKRSIVKSAVKQYGVMNRRFNPIKTKTFISQIKKLA